MTSLTYSAHMFVFVFLNAMDLSKEGCHDHLDADEWKDNLTDTVFLEMTKDPKDRVNCTLETECRGGREAACHLLHHCFNITNVMTKSPKCEWESLKEIPYYHFMCLIANAIELPSKACEYDTVCEIHSEKASTYLDPTTTQTTTTTTTPLSVSTTAAVATLEPTTTRLPETTSTTTTTTTLLPSSIATLEPTTTTATLPVLPSPITSAIATLESKTTTTPPLAEGQGNAKRNGADSLKYWLALSVLLNAILPPAVYLFMRHRWRRDRLHWTLTRVSSGGVTGDQPKAESDAPPASANQDAPTELLLQTNTHSEDTIHTQL